MLRKSRHQPQFFSSFTCRVFTRWKGKKCKCLVRNRIIIIFPPHQPDENSKVKGKEEEEEEKRKIITHKSLMEKKFPDFLPGISFRFVRTVCTHSKRFSNLCRQSFCHERSMAVLIECQTSLGMGRKIIWCESTSRRLVTENVWKHFRNILWARVRRANALFTPHNFITLHQSDDVLF